MNLRGLIVERIKSNGCGPFWLLDVYHHLVCSEGVPPDDASKAMSSFVDEIIGLKEKRKESV